MKEISEKLEEMKGEIRVVKGTVAEGATDSQALVSFFGKPLKTYSAVLKNGLKTVNACPKPKAPTIQGQLPGICRPLQEVKEDVAAHKKSLIIIGIPEIEMKEDDYDDPDVIALKQLFADCGFANPSFPYLERLGRKRSDGSARVIKVDFESARRVSIPFWRVRGVSKGKNSGQRFESVGRCPLLRGRPYDCASVGLLN
ncbi:MAG: hypothetical protein GY820_05875 [Gammaproteobacteria bacterium]|nr:hypothetical protein [Gammaproteobacteria bacterium]